MRSLLHGGSCLDRPRVQWLCHQEASPHLTFHSPRGTEPETQVCAGAEPKTLLQALQAAPERCVASDYNVTLPVLHTKPLTFTYEETETRTQQEPGLEMTVERPWLSSS